MDALALVDTFGRPLAHAVSYFVRRRRSGSRSRWRPTSTWTSAWGSPTPIIALAAGPRWSSTISGIGERAGNCPDGRHPHLAPHDVWGWTPGSRDAQHLTKALSVRSKHRQAGHARQPRRSWRYASTTSSRGSRFPGSRTWGDGAHCWSVPGATADLVGQATGQRCPLGKKNSGLDSIKMHCSASGEGHRGSGQRARAAGEDRPR